jgi:uncharacterized protein with PIN domain
MAKVRKIYECPKCKESLNQVENSFKARLYNLLSFDIAKAKTFHCTSCKKKYVVTTANKEQYIHYKKIESA